MRGRLPYVHEATLRLDGDTDPATVGATVTVELCGHWEHEGPCRWPHNSAIEVAGPVRASRTVFVASADDVEEVRARIERALRSSTGWTVLESGSRPLTDDERELGERLS